MRRLMLAMALWSAPGAAQTSPSSGTSKVIVARATGKKINDKLVEMIARTFRATPLSGASLRQAIRETPEQALARLCGSYRPALYDALKIVNPGEPIPKLRTVMGDAVNRLNFPACLRLTPITLRFPHLVPQAAAKSKSPYTASIAFTGGNLPQGAKTALVASPVELVPNDNFTLAYAARLIDNVDAGSVGVIADPIKGRIVEEVTAPPADVSDAAKAACPASSTAFDAALVKASYQYSIHRRPGSSRPGFAQVVIVDNGFLGVSLDPTATDPFTAAFPRTLFGAWASSNSLVGPITYYGADQYAPVIVPSPGSTVSPVTDVMGHGTHVAGLAVGGPDFREARDSLLLASPPAISMEILNLGQGQEYLLDQSQTMIRPLLAATTPGAPASGTRIVNMSLTYDGAQAEGTFDALFRENELNSLFVLAAGNSRDDVSSSSIFPAALGGNPNVLTVAAQDAGSEPQLAWFTNVGSAVDIAAPGCGIHSWLDASTESALTGTSEATPIASFAAALIDSLDGSLTPRELKLRLMASGHLLSDPSRWRVKSGSYLDIPTALLIYDDVLTLKRPDPTDPTKQVEETWLGKVTGLWGIRCTSELTARAAYGREASNFWSFKRDESGLELIPDRNLWQFGQPCLAATVPPKGTQRVPSVEFERRAQIIGSTIKPDRDDLSLGDKWTIELPTIDQLTLSAREGRVSS